MLVTSGHRVSCGCAFRDRKHGLSVDENGVKNRLYSVWTGIRSRCNNPNDSAYFNYGGRGISVCEDWDSYPVFHEWAITNGYDVSAQRGQCTLDRIDVNGDYTPDNCRWVTMEIQAKNKRPYTIVHKTLPNRDSILAVMGMAQMALDGVPLRKIAAHYGVSHETVRTHLLLKNAKETPSK